MRCETALAVILFLGVAHAAEPPDLSGSWTLNSKLSQDLVEKIKIATGGDEALSKPDLGRMRNDLMELARRGETLEIEQRPGEVQMAYANDDVRIFYPGREHTRERPGMGKIKAAPHWEGESLVIPQALPDGAKSVETYSLTDGGSRLAVMLKLEGKPLQEPLFARIVYDRAGAPPKP
jgi:hypothetical protein